MVDYYYKMPNIDRLWMDSYGLIYSADGNGC